MNKMFNRWLAKWRLVRRYKYLNEVNKILEEWTTNAILNGGSQEMLGKKRGELLKFQNEIKENEAFIKFLKELK